MVPKPDYHRQPLHLDERLNCVHPIPQGFESSRYRPQHSGFQIALPAFHRILRPLLLRHHHHLQRFLCLQTLVRQRFHNRVRWDSDLPVFVSILENLQENELRQAGRGGHFHWKGSVGCCRCTLASEGSQESAGEDLVLDCIVLVVSYLS